MVDPHHLTVYRSYFDEFGFCDLKALNGSTMDQMARYRQAYRKVWLDDLAGYTLPESKQPPVRSALALHNAGEAAMERVINLAQQGQQGIAKLIEYIKDIRAPGSKLKEANDFVHNVDLEIERAGFDQPELGPVTRMFVFAKENISGTDPVALASQMSGIYVDLERRCKKLSHYCAAQG